MADQPKPAPRRGRAVAAFTGRRRKKNGAKSSASKAAAGRRYGTTKAGSAGSY